MAKVTKSDTGKIRVATDLTVTEWSYLQKSMNDLMMDLMTEQLTDRGKNGAHNLLNLMNELLPDEGQMKKALE